MNKNRNYNRYYNNEPKESEVETTKVEEVVEEPETVEEVVEEPETVEEEREPLYEAVVDGCEKLRVRSEDKLGDNIVTTIEKGDHLYILSDNKDSDFYEVELEDGRIGYCMKTFVEIIENN